MLVWILSLSIGGRAQVVNLQELVNNKQYKSVIAEADHLSSSDSASYPTMYAIGQAYEGLLRYNQAYSYYQHCLSMDTTNLDMLNTLARTAINLGKATVAEKYFQKVLDTDTANFYANYQLARLYQQLGDYDKAIEKYNYLLEQDESNSALQKNIGDCYARQENWQVASAYYFSAYNHNRENAVLASSTINSLLHIGGPYIEDALIICDTALYYNPQSRLLYQNKAMALYMNKEYAKADTIYTMLLSEGDSSYLTVKYGGASKYYAGFYLPSVETLELAYKMDTTSAEVCLLLGSALGKTYDRKRAYALLDKAEENMKPSPSLSNQLTLFRAETLQKDNRPREATFLYYQAWQKNPKRIDLLMHIANMNGALDIKNYKTTNDRQRGVFAQVLYVTEFLKTGEEPKGLIFHRLFLETLYEDMFFRNIAEEPMLSPDGKKSMLSVHDLRSLINRLPEISKETKPEIFP